MKDWSKFQKARLNSTIGNCTKQFALYYMQSLWTLSPVHGERTESAANRVAKERGPAAQHTVTILHSQTTGQPREDGKKEDEGNDADRAQGLWPPPWRYHHNFNYLYRCLRNCKSRLQR